MRLRTARAWAAAIRHLAYASAVPDAGVHTGSGDLLTFAWPMPLRHGARLGWSVVGPRGSTIDPVRQQRAGLPDANARPMGGVQLWNGVAVPPSLAHSGTRSGLWSVRAPWLEPREELALFVGRQDDATAGSGMVGAFDRRTSVLNRGEGKMNEEDLYLAATEACPDTAGLSPSPIPLDKYMYTRHLAASVAGSAKC